MSPPKSQPTGDSKPTHEEFRPSFRALAGAVMGIGAAYFYFLIFAQFGFLRAVQSLTGEDGALLRPVMALMGTGGIAGSIGMARLYTGPRGRFLLWLGFALCGLAAGISLGAGQRVWFMICAALIGLGTGIITVTLAALLRREVGGQKLGICVGAGTGLAYGLCNLPPVFNAGAAGQAAMGIVACAAGSLAVLGFEQRALRHQSVGVDYSPVGIGGWVAVFAALVWLDSAAFYVIQHTPGLKGGTWGGDAQLYLNAIVHGAAALLAGLMLDRRLVAATVLAAAGLLVAADLLLGNGSGTFATAAFLYAAGVSFYSAALIFYPARSGRAGLAALVYGVAGWGGSALGIGMARNLSALPLWFLIIVSVVIAGVFFGRFWLTRRGRLIMSGGGVALLMLSWPQNDLRASDGVDLGRKVYIAEGCTHCHSQYVRPGTADELLWGPPLALEKILEQKPPLLGNRRQGPDLQNVGLRRTRDWNRRHLTAPRVLMPGSRMPSYKYLFSADAGRGEALLDYLASLGPPAGAGPGQ